MVGPQHLLPCALLALEHAAVASIAAAPYWKPIAQRAKGNLQLVWISWGAFRDRSDAQHSALSAGTRVASTGSPRCLAKRKYPLRHDQAGALTAQAT